MTDSQSQPPADSSRRESDPAPHPAPGIKRQFAWSLAPLLVVTVLNLFSVRLFFRYLGDEIYALWGYVATFTGMFGFADLGLGVAVGRYMGVALGRGDREAVREYWGTGNVIALPLLGLMGAVFALLGVFCGPHWFNVSPANAGLLRACFAVGGLALFVSYYSQFWLILSQAHLDFKFIGILRSVGSIVQIVPAILLARWTKDPLILVSWAAGVGFLQLIVFIWHARRKYRLGAELRHARRARFQEMAAYTGKSFAALVVGSFFGSIDRFVLGRLAPSSGTDFTNYTNGAVNVGSRLQGLGVAVMGPVFYNTTRTAEDKQGAASARIYNETFNFIFGWYLLAAIWVAAWHPVLLRLWLGSERGAQVAPLFTPIVVAYCLTAMANISTAQLGAINRLGTVLGFSVVNGLFTAAGVYLGWRLGGIVGVAYGFLCSRIVNLAQDVYTLLLIKAGGWFSPQTWKSIGAQLVVGGIFGCACLSVPRESYWLLIPATLHGGLVAAWLSRHYVRKFLTVAFVPQPTTS